MKKNELVPVGNGESFTRCGWIRLALKTLFEDPHASFFVETIPLCVQLNLIVLLRLAIVGAFSLEIPRLFAVILGLFITTLICINLLPIPGFDGVSLHDMFPHQLKIGFGTVLCGLAANWAVLAVGYALCFLPWWVSFLIVLVLTVMAALLLPSRHSVCWARMLSTFCLLPVMIKSLGFELLAVSLPTAILNIGFCLLLSYLTAPVLLELIFVSYLYQK